LAGDPRRLRLESRRAWLGQGDARTQCLRQGFADMGFDSMFWIWSGLAIEFAGGIALILGLFTRFWAAAAAIELAIITMIYWKTGFSWLSRGYEYTLLWGLVCFAIALRGGGPYSVDRAIGKEL